ncbi:Ribose import ATP-binding protein RbsA [Baekduia alba]|uniref:sugar ABC transporter ATP-binding protein n=1 Tax=Baekduia alba TaxID=2997333 RepID=UPI0023423527|nr:sugar ABC transporter ATP-binding protein [Baekduia alba]WCB96858.1 Ribose import ATP-binding protein RbsA [Baekduia alba]
MTTTPLLNGQGRTAALTVSRLSKTFPGTQALCDVSFAVAPGQIHGLLGGNGSGKSTLIKILAGVHAGDAGGELAFGTRTVASDATTPELAYACGLRFVHQSSTTFPDMTVAENIAIGGGFPTRLGRVRWGQLRRETRSLLERFEIDAHPDDLLGELGAADQTMVTIARALQDEDGDGGAVSVLVLDEPTASLPEHEVDVLLSALRRYAAQGQTILYVSHRIEEVLSITDAVTVLRDGQHVVTRPTEGLTEAALIEHIVGRPLEQVFSPPSEQQALETLLQVQGLGDGERLKDVSFTVGRGEVVGIAGLLGSGRTELLELLFGLRAPAGGQIRLGGDEVRIGRPKDAMALGIAFVPEDRELDAAFLDMTVRENLSAAQVGRYQSHGRIQHAQERADALRSIEEFTIRTPGDGELLSSLSGGNQQKVILARWLRRDPRLLLLDEPTQGVDVGARADAYRSVRRAVEGGMGAILVTSDFEELALASDRVLVLRGGRLVAELRGDELSRQRLTELVFTTQEEAA